MSASAVPAAQRPRSASIHVIGESGLIGAEGRGISECPATAATGAPSEEWKSGSAVETARSIWPLDFASSSKGAGLSSRASAPAENAFTSGTGLGRSGSSQCGATAVAAGRRSAPARPSVAAS